MTRLTGLVTLVVAVALGAVLSGQSASDLFQKALVAERAAGNLRQAIQLYQQVVDTARARGDRTLAARALVRMAECHQKLGDRDAARIYERLVKDYADLPEASEARRRLASAGPAPRSTGLVARLLWTGGDDYASHITPDGRKLVTTDWITGDLVIRDVATGDTRRLLVKKGDTWGDVPPTNGEFGESPVLSHDQQQVAYLWFTGSPEMELRVTRAQPGSTPRTVFRSAEYAVYPQQWSADGRAVMVEVIKPNDAGIGWVSTADGTLRIVKRLEGRTWEVRGRPTLSPDGKHIAYAARMRRDAANSSIHIMAADGSNDVEAVTEGGVNEAPVWTQDGKYLLFTSDRSGTFDLYALPVVNGRPTGDAVLLKAEIGRVWSIGTTTADAFYYQRGTTGLNVMVAELDAASSRPRGSARRLSESSVNRNSAPAWSPDGRSIAFKRERQPSEGTGHDLVVRRLDTGEERVVKQTTTSGNGRPLWFHDNRHVGVAVARGNGSALRKVDRETGEATDAVTLPFRLATRTAALSADDRTLFALAPGTAVDDTAYRRVVAIDVASGAMRTIASIPRGEFAAMALSPDGATIAVWGRPTATDRAAHLATVRVDGTGYRELIAIRNMREVPSVVWTADGNALLFPQLDRGQREPLTQYALMRLPLDSLRAVATGLTFTGQLSLDVNYDGSRIAFSERTREKDQVWVLENVLANQGER